MPAAPALYARWVTPRDLSDGARLREARRGDEPGILACIQALADYEREPDAVDNTVDALAATLFGDDPCAFAHVVDRDGEIVGIAIWFLTYSTWTGRHGIWLEDLIVLDSYRGRGYGMALIASLAAVCVDRDYTRLEWTVLDWNAPSIAFYRSLGAIAMDEWTTQRLTGDALAALAAGGR
jgi:GNAT superfamily N-acetyltransferase